MKKKKTNIWKNFNIYYRYSRSNGILSFVLSNLIKIAVIIGGVLLLVWILNAFIIEVSEIPQYIIDNFRKEIVLLFFFLTESFLGLIPPDFFILWVSKMEYFYAWVGLLGFISYLGGITAYFIGTLIRRIPKLEVKLLRLYSKNLDKIKKWGGIFIVIAALLPLPYATVCTLAGMLKYPLSRLPVIGLFRIARFYIYAPIVLGIV